MTLITTYSAKEIGLCHEKRPVLTLLSLEGLDRACRQEDVANRYLRAGEQKQYTSYSHDKRRMEWLGGRTAAKHGVLKLNPEMGWQDVEIEATPHGRPVVLFYNAFAHLHPPDISISHSHGLAGALIVETGLCGMDIQKVVPSVMKIKDRFATAQEVALIRKALPDSDSVSKEVVLTMLWAAKESLRKAADTSPLPGFLELLLIDAAPVPDTSLYTSGVRLHFAGMSSPVISGMRDDFAVALTVVS